MGAVFILAQIVPCQPFHKTWVLYFHELFHSVPFEAVVPCWNGLPLRSKKNFLGGFMAQWLPLHAQLLLCLCCD